MHIINEIIGIDSTISISCAPQIFMCLSLFASRSMQLLLLLKMRDSSYVVQP